jgi:hypothetical protein
VIGDREMRFLLALENRLEIRFQMVTWRFLLFLTWVSGIPQWMHPPVVVRVCDAYWLSMYYTSRDIKSLAASLLFRMFPDLRNNLKRVARRFTNVP